MKFHYVNCGGLGNPTTIKALKKLLTSNKTDIVFVMETKTMKYDFRLFFSSNDLINKFTDCSTFCGAGLVA